MDYQKIYNQLVSKRQQELPEGYTEKHHIIPKCMGGTNEKENLVRLTAREHFIAHQLLVKIYPNEHKLLYACNRITNNNKNSSKMYEWLRKKHSNMLSTHRSGINHPSFNKKFSKEHNQKISDSLKGNQRALGMIHSDETKEKISKANSGENNAMYGKTHDENIKIKISENTKKGMTEEVKNKMRVPKSEEAKRKMSESAKKRWAKINQ